MRLTRLYLAGFKTFADKTELELGQGLTAVVGPNGCGKSNITDAILWVLGEQNPRLLRGSEARDVIFAGTDRRKPLGMAEVRLTIDNSDKALPVEFSEVVVSRRLYRSGESQYLLNNSQCRLKDIVDLFLDTGMGKGAYSFVSQSEIDAVLSARPEERRELFEEAAGIKKYRVRKREAVRKLEQAETHLTRVRDILHELEAQREPLAAQAETAKRYKELGARLQEIELDLLVAEAHRLDYELFAAREQCESGHSSMLNFERELACLERDSQAHGVLLAEAEAELDSARMTRQAILSSVERSEARLQLLDERAETAESAAEGLKAELSDLGTRKAKLEAESAELAASQETALAISASSSLALVQAQERLGAAEAALASAQDAVEQRRAAEMRTTEERAQTAAAAQMCRVRLADAEAMAERLESAKAEISNLLERAMRERDAAQTRIESAESVDRDITQRLLQAEQAKRSALEVRSALREDLDSLKRSIADRSSRLSTLREMARSGEGFYQGVRAVVQAVSSGALRGDYAPVVDLLRVPDRLRTAIEVALGASAQDIVCKTEEEAKAAITWLKQNRMGRATFLPLPAIRPSTGPSSEAVKRCTGVVGLASDLVEIDSGYEPILRLLLGRTVICTSIDDASAASRALSGWSRIVTLEGELITPGGAMTGGSLHGRGSHLLGRKGEIDDLAAEVLAQTASADSIGLRASAAQEHVVGCEADVATITPRLFSHQATIASLRSELAAHERDVKRLAAEAQHTQAEAASACAAVGMLSAELGQWQQDHSEADDTHAPCEPLPDSVDLGRLTELRDDARRSLEDLRVEAGRQAERLNSLASAMRAAQAGLGDLAHLRDLKQRQCDGIVGQWRDSGAQREETLRALEEAKTKAVSADEMFSHWQARKQELLQRSFDMSNETKRIARERTEIVQEVHTAELAIARMEVRVAQNDQRLWDEYTLTHEDVLARHEPADVDHRTSQEVARLRREIRNMGDVNTGAVEEYERLSERETFLAAQQEDLQTAVKSLNGTISEIDASTRGVFLSTFEAVSTAFAELFERLFEGGTTRLVLTSPDDLLETGIEVIAQPPGKRPQHLSLLSGGERALTAVALLFAFIAVHPSPFVLLDEVDAPLDGANVQKFAELVREFSTESQMLVITHNPTTMEAAPRWYGVTMNEPGVSRVITYRLPSEAMETEPDAPMLVSAG